MILSRPSMIYLAEALEGAYLSHNYLNRVCHKIDVPVEYSYDKSLGSQSLSNRLWALIMKLNGTNKLDQLLQIIYKEYQGYKVRDKINNALKMSGYFITEDGKIISQMGEQIGFVETQNQIEMNLQKMGFEGALKDFKEGVANYGEGKLFSPLRRSLEGIITEILKENGIDASNMRKNIDDLVEIGILRKEPELSIQGRKYSLESIHAYGIYKIISHYIEHYNEFSEEDKHFIFFQTMGLIWLITHRYLSIKNI